MKMVGVGQLYAARLAQVVQLAHSMTIPRNGIQPSMAKMHQNQGLEPLIIEIISRYENEGQEKRNHQVMLLGRTAPFCPDSANRLDTALRYRSPHETVNLDRMHAHAYMHACDSHAVPR